MPPAPFFEGGGATVYHGEALAVLRGLAADTYDLVCTSPPYNCRKPYDGCDDQWPWPEYYTWMRDVIGECYRVLAPGGVLAVNVPPTVKWQVDHRHADTWQDFDPRYETHRRGARASGRGRIEPVGFKLYEMMWRADSHVREPIAWVKGDEGEAYTPDPRTGSDADPFLRSCYEFVLLGSKARWHHRGGTGRRGAQASPRWEGTKDVWHIRPEADADHPAVFPAEIPRRLCKLFVHAEPGRVLDPFAGRGTTLRAAVALGHEADGVDASAKYCRIMRGTFSQGGLGF